MKQALPLLLLSSAGIAQHALSFMVAPTPYSSSSSSYYPIMRKTPARSLASSSSDSDSSMGTSSSSSSSKWPTNLFQEGLKMTRGGFSVTAAGAALAALLAGPSQAEGAGKRTVVLTGASSGIGLDAATKLVAMGHDVHVACRTEAKAKAAAEASGAAGAFACDLSSLESVRGFVDAWKGKPIDTLCLNAGMAPSTKGSPGYCTEGFEETVGTNHLGHFLLANLLIKPLEAGALRTPRLVVTASSVHDPDTPGGNQGSKATLGDMSGLERYLAADGESKKFDMVDGGEYDGDKAYKDSKLCNVLFTLEAQRRLSARRSAVKVDCFSPGLIPSSGLFRNQNPIFSKIFDFAATNLIKASTHPPTVGQGGDTLVEMVTELSLQDGAAGGRFFATEPGKPESAFSEQAVSVEARDVAKGKRLWELSAGCVGLDPKTPI
ncbi:unnamed protein product [Ectocarpus sp. 6 AP-2014]